MQGLNAETKFAMGNINDVDAYAKSITFCVTESCNLACKYCYMTGKNSNNKMSFEVARKAVDIFLDTEEFYTEYKSVLFDFIGGEPFLEIDLIDRICDYIKLKLYMLDHPWQNNYKFGFSTNGILYDRPEVQRFIHKNRNNIGISFSVDGSKRKHDLQRVRPDGSGSYDDVAKNVPLWLEQFPGASTKATFAHEDLPYLKESIINIWNLGIKTVYANVIFENVWQDGDDVIYEQQIRELGDYVLEKGLWKDHAVSFLNYMNGFVMGIEDDHNFCGSGDGMIAVDCKGDFYPCVRFYDFSLNNRKAHKVGDISRGINFDRLRPYKSVSLHYISNDECRNCEVASGCAYCAGFDYDEADTDTIFQRATYICKMHKANVRANVEFWKKFSKATGLPNPREEYKRKFSGKNERFLFFITSDNITPHCYYRNWNNTNNTMSEEMLAKGLKFASDNDFTPVILIDDARYLEYIDNNDCIVLTSKDAIAKGERSIVIYDNEIPEGNNPINASKNSILLINADNVTRIYDNVAGLFTAGFERVNLICEDIDRWDEDTIGKYETELGRIKVFLIEALKNNRNKSLNVINDILLLDKMCNCDAGEASFTLAPNGKFYICPAFYFSDPSDTVGGLEENKIMFKNSRLLELEQAPICSKCDAYHCKRCKYLDIKLTGEINTPSRNQCVVSHTERNVSMDLQRILEDESGMVFPNKLTRLDYLDPLEIILKLNKGYRGGV